MYGSGLPRLHGNSRYMTVVTFVIAYDYFALSQVCYGVVYLCVAHSLL